MVVRPASLAAIALFAGIASAQFVVDTIAGTDLPYDIALNLEDARGIAIDGQRNVYVSEPARHRVLKFSPSGVSVLAGTGFPGFTGDDGPADQAMLNQPYGLAADSAGNVFIADLQNARIRRVGADGRISTVAGGGVRSVTSLNPLATDVALKAPRNVSLDASGNLYFADFLDHRVFKIASDRRLSIVAGTGQPGPAVDQASALTAALSYPAGLFIDSQGLIYIADSGNHVIRRVQGNLMVRLNIPNLSSIINLPTSIAVDTLGNLLIASAGYDQAVRVSPAGVSSVLLKGVREIALDSTGTLYATSGDAVRRVSSTGTITTMPVQASRFRGENSPAKDAWLSRPEDVKADASGALFIADTQNHRVRKVAAGVITTIAGNGEPTLSGLHTPQGLAIDVSGNLFIADSGNHRIRRVAPDGLISTIAGTGVSGFNGDIKEALQLQLNSPSALALDRTGNLYIADTANHRIRRLISGGLALTIVGTGTRGFSGDGAGSLNAQLDSPRGLAFDTQGNLYIADSGNARIRKVTPVGIISTVAMNLPGVTGLAIDDKGILWATDTTNHKVRRIEANGEIKTAAGTGLKGFGGDKGPALDALFDEPAGLALDSSGVVYVADRGNHRIRKLAVETVAPPPPPPPPPLIELAPTVTSLHGATLESTAAAPGMLIALQGTSIGPTTALSGRMSSSGQLDTTLGDTQVKFDGKPAPILYAQEHMINVQAPYSLAGRSLTQVEIVREGKVKATVTLPVVPAAPGIFTASGSGLATALLEDSSLNSSTNPVAPGGLVTIYATGEGLTDPILTEGKLADFPFPTPVAVVVVTVGSHVAEIVSAFSASTSPGVLQVSFRVPPQSTAGLQPLQLFIGGAPSQKGVNLFVK